MRITDLTVRSMLDGGPEDRNAPAALALFDAFDGLSDSYMAGFDNYPAPAYRLVAAWRGKSAAAVTVLVGPVITAWVGNEAISEKMVQQGYDELLAHLKERFSMLIVHDADKPEPWQAAGFLPISPPRPLNPAEPVAVWAWNTSPAEAHYVIEALGMKWDAQEHRGQDTEEISEEISADDKTDEKT